MTHMPTGLYIHPFRMVWAAVMTTLLTGYALAAVAVPTGAAIYSTNCAGCHGVQARGGTGPALYKAGNPNYAASWSAALFSRAMLKGQDDKGVAFKAPMPTFGRVGFAGDHGKAPTPAEIRSLQTYLKSLK